MFERDLAPHRLAPRGQLFRVDEPHGSARARISRPATGLMRVDALGYVKCPTGIERAIGTAEQVDKSGAVH